MKHLVTFIFYLSIHGGYTQTMETTKLKSYIDFDGIVGDQEWEDVPQLSLVQHTPVFGNAPSEKTEIYLAYDDKYVYLAGRLYYENPDDLQNTSKKRDALEGSTDYFGILIDSYNDNENGLAFFTTPAGLRFDASVSNDGVDFSNVNTSWNTFWDAITHITEDGWFAEIRIPFTSLRFQEYDGLATMGITVWRYMASKSEVIIFPAISNALGSTANWRVSQAQKMNFKDIYPKKPVYVAPYLLTGLDQVSELNTRGDAYHIDDDFKIEAGLDLKQSLSSSFTMDLTVNPDFAQVEADDQQLNLTRFSLFFPEKRLFFQERSGVFDFRMGGPNRLFYSRRIGLDEDGNPIRIYGGVRLIGRIGKWDLGFLDMQTSELGDIPSENYGVVRVRKQVFNNYSYLGGMIVNKIDVNGNFNTGIGIDGIMRLYENNYMDFQYAQTYFNGSSHIPFSPDNAKIRINFEKRQLKGFGYDLGFSRVGEEYEPEMGFETRENYYRLGDRLWYGWLPGENSRILDHQLFIRASTVVKNNTGKIESAQLGAGWSINLKNTTASSIAFSHQIENLTDTFEISDDVFVTVGDYEFNKIDISFNTPYSNPISLSNNISFGSFFDGNRFGLQTTPSWKVSPSLEFSLNYIYSRVDFSERKQLLNAHIGRFRTVYMFSTKLSASAFIQYNSADNVTVGNLRIRFNPKEGNDLYIVFNETRNNDIHRESPTLLNIENRTILLKYTYTFVWGK